jgi:hypothetical protein
LSSLQNNNKYYKHKTTAVKLKKFSVLLTQTRRQCKRSSFLLCENSLNSAVVKVIFVFNQNKSVDKVLNSKIKAWFANDSEFKGILKPVKFTKKVIKDF